MATQDGKVLELVVFKLRAGASREELLGTVDAVSAWIAQQPGFVARSLVEDREGGGSTSSGGARWRRRRPPPSAR